MIDLDSFHIKIFEYNEGRTKSVSIVHEIRPPITTVAKGFSTSAPSLIEKAIGKNPRQATEAVAITGLNRSFAAAIAASTGPRPELRFSFTHEIRTTPFLKQEGIFCIAVEVSQKY